jgi:uncharacterized surface protein with fasciclin (FAS1) repeats
MKKNWNTSLKYLAGGLSVLALVACDSAELGDGTDAGAGNGGGQEGSPATANLVDTAVSAGSFDTLVAALQATGLDTVLADGSQTYTVFAPTDAAFEQLGGDTLENLLDDPDTLRDILLYHVVPGSVNAESAISLAGSSVETANGDSIALSLQDGALFINDSEVVTTDVNATNGIIHVIDAVLLPPADGTANIVDTAVGAGSFTTLVAALQATGLDSVLADGSQTFTVFAPTDDAFSLLGSETIDNLLADPDTLRDILLYHVLSGSAVDSTAAIGLAGSSVEATNGDQLAISVQGDALFINDSEVTGADVQASNGIIHVIDAVLLPPTDDGGDTGGGDNGGGDNGGGDGQLVNIVDTAVAAGSFNTLAAALQATGLDDVLADESQRYTVFAPNDAAFDKLGQDTINALLADTDTLRDILLYHVIGGTAVDAATALSIAGTKVTAANDDEFALSVNDGALFVNLSEVIATDVDASNGVIHVIDTVLIPPMIEETHGTVVDLAVADGRFTTLVAALQATGLDVTLADHDGTFTVFAPTDDAFAVLGTDTINALLGDLPTLSNILLTHVISGATIDSVTAFSLAGSSAETASGTSVSLSISDGSLFINNARVIQTDIKAENGTIHVIDAVIQ